MNENNKKIIEEISLNMEIHKCALCHNAPCNKIYKNVDPERIIRALMLDNKKGARTLFNDNFLLKDNSCNEMCPLNIDIDAILKNVFDNTEI